MKRRDSFSALALVAGTIGADAAPVFSGADRAGNHGRASRLGIGVGRPRIIVSLTGADRAGMVAQARRIVGRADVDIVELRMDHLAAPGDADALAGTVAAVAGLIEDRPLLATFRSRREGGERQLSPQGYAALYRAVLPTGLAAGFDLEQAMLADDSVAALMAQAQAAGIAVIVSHHDFGGTPSVDEMLATLRRQHASGADICKMAVMPHDAGDVLRLLDATRRMRTLEPSRPLITMAMGGLGAVSRMAGEVFGSAASFGALGGGSAPGQIEVAELRAGIDTLAGALGGGRT
ncbi:type I 3-dehydroquinate dehydratase [Xylophilus sp. GOD-11R]|uniref:type I 3-dehydroquinate dehydratase n=1 Tax=Xylophilus sp. GOD-11R TaxID=3089814 RepID=UPI00298CE656|nr:type I 3-dehydroquinate dehydratase [Xylophilus sp. GOD-11R]WPB58443.1 type I 3-dehydroquinate dehydratase [Xylophilus sp. GOD-11R]